jgi:hypothetical protein
MLGRLLAICGVLAAGPAFANDSVAELGTGGLIMSRTDAVSMLSENLYISPQKVTVDYVFKNQTDKDVEAIVAFPMPDIDGSIYDRPAIPDEESDNFLGFEVTIDGQAVKPELEQKAIAVGVDVSDFLKANGVPVNPFAQPVFKALENLSKGTAQDFINRGLMFIDEYDDGAGWKKVRTPLWSLRSTYWWKANFLAGKEVKVSHRYKPSVGGTAGLNFFFDNKFDGAYNDYKDAYCIDKDFEQAVLKAAKDSPEGYPLLMEQRLDYVLTTGGNWALGAIGDFKLTVDKGDEKNVVSFCGENVRKTGPTTFEMTAKDYYPEKDLKILILTPYEMPDLVPPGDAPTTNPGTEQPQAPAGSGGAAPGNQLQENKG